MPEATRPLRVFLCHAREDKPIVRELYRQLDSEGWIDAWLDVEKLYPGQDWNLEIEQAVEAADVIIVCLSNHSVSKEGYVQREIRMVLDLADYKPEGTLFIIPVRLEECEPPRRLRRWQYADYFPQNDRDWAYGRLLISLRSRAKALGIMTKAAESKPTPVRPKPAKARPDVESKREIAQVVKHPSTAKTTPGGHVIYTFGDIEFVKVPAGKFLMGISDKDKKINLDEMPQHTVDITYDSYIGRFPVTNEQYAAYVKAKGFTHPVSDWRDSGKRDHPVVNVSWNDAMAYCQWLNGSTA